MKRFNIIPLLLLWIFITSAGPFMFISIPGHPHKILTGSCLLIMITMLVIFKRKVVIRNQVLYFIFLAQACYYLFGFSYHEDNLYILLFLQIIGIAVSLIFLQNYISTKQLSISILVAMCIMGITGTIVFLLAITGIIQPFSILSIFGDEGQKSSDLYNYILTFSNSVFFYSKYQIIRIAGYFDEPGTFAFYLIHALLLNKISVNKKLIEYILIIAGLLSLSLAFYISLGIYLLLFNIRIQLKLKPILIIAVILVLMNTSTSLFPERVRTVTGFISSRLELSDSYDLKLLKGDSRTEAMINDFPDFVEKPFLGRGKIRGSNSPSIIGLLVNDGLIGAIFIFMHVLYFASKSVYFQKNKPQLNSIVIKSSFLLFLNFIQRPFITGIFPYMIYISLIYYAERQNVSLKRLSHNKSTYKIKEVK